jgi:hypothetical protein
MKKDLPAVQKAYDLCKEIIPRVSRFPRDYKFTIGDRIIGNCLAVLELLIQASYRRDKIALLDEANLRLERLRFLLRLCRDLGALSNKGYEHVMKMITELGSQVGGWRKQAAGKGEQV